jgi:signal peptidase II
VIYFLGMALLIAFDQWTKKWAIDALMLQGPKSWIEGFLGFRYAENTGAAFSILRDKQLLLIILTSVIILGLCGYLIKAIRTDAHVTVKWAYMLLISGAIGNFIDRVRLNYVVDFLEFRFINFPIFNIADVCVVVGVSLLAGATFFFKYDF